MTRLVPRVALQLWIITFATFLGAGVVLEDPGLRVLTQALYGVPLAAWGIVRLRSGWDGVDLTVLLAVAAHLIVALLSRDKTESLGSVPLTAAYAATFLIARRESGTSMRPVVVHAFAIGLTLSLLLNAGLLIAEKIRWMTVVGTAPLEGLVVFPWGTVNALPVLVLVAAPFVAWCEPRLLRTILAIALVAAAVIVVPVSLGRAGWFGLGVAAIAWLLLWPSARSWWSRTRVPPQALVAGVAVVAVVTAVLMAPVIASALAPTGRLALWEQAALMIADHPISGSGPGTYSWARLEYGPQPARLLPVFLVHNLPLQTLVDGGLLLMAGLGAAVVAWGSAVMRGVAAFTANERLAVAVLIGFAGSTLLDDFTFNPAIVAGVLVMAGFLVPRAPVRPATGLLARWAPVALAGITILGLGSTVAVDHARAAAEGARQAAVEGRWAEAVSGFAAAADAHPQNAGYWLGIGVAASHAGSGEAARTAYPRAMTVSPGDPRGYAGTAAFASEDDRLVLVDRAAQLTLGDPTFAAWLSQAYLDSGDVQSATDAWAAASVLAPELLRAAEAELDVPLDTVLAGALTHLEHNPLASPVDTERRRWDLLLAAGRVPNEAGPAWRAVAAAANGRAEVALELVADALREAPRDARTYAAEAMVAAYACDAVSLDRALDRLEVAGGAWRTDEPPADVAVEREFTYRQDGLGVSLPPSAPTVELHPWPWGLVPDPEPCA